MGRGASVALLIPVAVVALIILGMLNVVSFPVVLVGILVALVIAARRLDRGRGAGAPSPVRDPHRPDFYGEASTWQIPTPYIDHPTGAGEPPGVDRGDEPQPRR